MELIINGERIEQQAVDQEIRRVRMNEPGLSEKKAKDRAVQFLTRRILLVQEAEKSPEEVSDAEVGEEFNRLLAQHGGAKAFYGRFNLSPKDEPAVRRDLARQLGVDKLIGRLTGSVRKPTDEEIRAEYDKDPEAYRFEEAVKASHIVMSPGGQDSEDVYSRMVEVRKKLLSGADFAETADEYSGCSDAGGDLGMFGRGKMVEEFETVVFSMEPEEISPVFRTQFGYHVAKVFERRPAKQKTFEEAKNEIFTALYEEKKEAALAVWTKKKSAASQIVVKDG